MTTKDTRYAAYYRVSTQRQGQSGLGLQAQRQAVMQFINGGGATVEREFVEVETGKGADAMSRRPVLREALAYCQETGSTLVIAKLDRLSRDVAFISAIMNSKAQFVCADNPTADRFVLHVQAAFAESERARISKRTREALQAAKERGVRLGSPTIAGFQKKRAKNNAERFRHTLAECRRLGMSQRQMVHQLNLRGAPTPSGRGTGWTLVQVQRTLKRLGL